MVAIERLVPPFLSCERDVTIAADGIKHDGCRDVDVTIHFDPNVPDIPFKGTSLDLVFGASYYHEITQASSCPTASRMSPG